jgi:hypothetical protein
MLNTGRYYKKEELFQKNRTEGYRQGTVLFHYNASGNYSCIQKLPGWVSVLYLSNSETDLKAKSRGVWYSYYNRKNLPDCVQHQCCGTVTIYYGSGSGSGSDF